MPNITPKTCANAFYKARIAVSAHNEQLSSREGAAEIMAIDRGRLYRIENDIAAPYPEEVHMMADLYNAPKLRSHYCHSCCPLGRDVPEVDADSLDRIAVKAVASFRRIRETNECLLDITEDGIISDGEKPQMERILRNLDDLTAVAHNLRIWVEKNL